MNPLLKCDQGRMMQATSLNNTDLLQYDLFMFSQNDAIICGPTEYSTKSKILQVEHWLSKAKAFLNCVKLKRRGSKTYVKISLLWKSAVCSGWNGRQLILLNPLVPIRIFSNLNENGCSVGDPSNCS